MYKMIKEIVVVIVLLIISLLVKLKLLDKEWFGNIYNDLFFYGMFGLFIGVVLHRMYKDGKVKNEIEKALLVLNDLENKEYDGINDEFNNVEKFPILSSIWKGFNESKIEMEENGSKKTYQTIDADNFFNNDVLLKEKMNTKFLNYIPQLLVGLGLLGTFLGLSIGLSGLDLKNTNDIGQINQLIDGVKTSFYTSLYGMYFSISFSILISLHMGEIEEKILRLKDKMNGIFHKNNGTEMLEEMKQELKKIRESNDGMATNIANQLGNEFEKMRLSSENSIKEVSELISSKIGGISQGISGSFEKSIGDSLEKIFSSDFVEKFENIKNQLIDVSEKNNQFISEYKNEIRDIAYTTGELKDSYISTSNKIIEDFNLVSVKLEEKYHQVENIYDNSMNMYKNLNEFYEKNSLLLEESNKFINKFESITINLNGFLESQESVVTLWSSYKSNFDKLSESINENMKNYEEMIRYGTNEYTKIISESSELYGKIISKNSEDYGNLIDKRTLEYTENVNNGISKLFNEYEENLTGVIDKFNGVLKSFKVDIGEMTKVIENNFKIVIENDKSMKQLNKIREEQLSFDKSRDFSEKNKETKGE